MMEYAVSPTSLEQIFHSFAKEQTGSTEGMGVYDDAKEKALQSLIAAVAAEGQLGGLGDDKAPCRLARKGGVPGPSKPGRNASWMAFPVGRGALDSYRRVSRAAPDPRWVV